MIDIKHAIAGILIALASFFGGMQLAPSHAVVGSATGPDMPFKYLNVGGVVHNYESASLGSATSTVCSLQSPPATSTLLFAGIDITGYTSTTTTGFISIAATRTASTTVISQGPVTKNGTSYIVAASLSTTTSQISPSQYINFTMYTDGSVNSPSGDCSAEFIQP